MRIGINDERRAHAMNSIGPASLSVLPLPLALCALLFSGQSQPNYPAEP